MRNRVIVWSGAVAALAAAIVAGVILLVPGESSLARAASRLDGATLRVHIKSEGKTPSSSTVVQGTQVWDPATRRLRLEGKTTIDGQELDQTILGIGEDMWVHTAQFAEFMPPGKRWVHTVEPIGGMNSMTLSQYVAYLRDDADVQAVGEREVRGERATVYKGEMNFEDFLDATGGETEEYFEDRMGGRELILPLEAWITDDGRLMRVSVTATVGRNSDKMTIDVLDYNVPVDVKPPPVSETVTEEEFNRIVEAA